MTLSKESVAVITGAGSGIGRALAVRLADEGIRGISICDRDAAELLKTAELIDGQVEVLSSVVDVSSLEDVARFREETLEKFGTATHLINNAGVGLIGRVVEVSLEDIDWLMGINFWGTVYPTKLFLPDMLKQNAGHIVNISSIFGIIAPPGQAAYCASKFAVRGFTESLRHELELTPVHVSCVHPGGIRTNIVRSARQGKNAPDEDVKVAPIIFDKVVRTSPDQAAATIIRGIKTRSPRILIGSDARQISGIQRLFPKRYFKIVDRLSGGMLSKFR